VNILLSFRRLAAMTILAMAAVLTIGVTSANASTGATPFSVLQMNLCLSGIAGCYPGTDYPAVVNEAIGNIQADQPDVATLVETCSGDAQHIADATGYHLAFGTVIYRGAPLPCVKPTGRGVYGISLLTKRPLVAVDDAPYTAQNGNEQRRRVCGTTDQGVRKPAAPASAARDRPAHDVLRPRRAAGESDPHRRGLALTRTRDRADARPARAVRLALRLRGPPPRPRRCGGPTRCPDR
jgi:hypothetical protein